MKLQEIQNQPYGNYLFVDLSEANLTNETKIGQMSDWWRATGAFKYVRLKSQIPNEANTEINSSEDVIKGIKELILEELENLK